MDIRKDELLARKSKLSPAKRALLEKRLRGEVESNSKLKTIPRRAEQSPAPLSFAQQRLWFLHQFDSGNAYNEISSVHLKGSLNVEALEKSLNEIVRRHEALRTTFEMVDGQAVQVIHPSWDFRLSILDFSTVQNSIPPNPPYQGGDKIQDFVTEEVKNSIPLNPPYQGGDKIQDFVTEEVKRFFDLTKAPLLRGTLLKLGEQEYVLVFVMHHIICDGWSMRSLIREVAALYEAFSHSKPSSLPELPIQYADFAVWQRQWSKEHLQNHLSYWKQQLAGATTVLELPTDKPRPAVQSFRGATTHFQLSPSLTEKLKYLSQQSGCTLFMTLLAAFQTLLYRYTGQDDISVGTPIANRKYSEIQGLIGVFVNTLVMRTDLSGNPSFRELLNRVRQVALGAYANEELPFEQLVEELQPERNLSHQPLFQVMFVLQEDPMPELILPGLTLTRLQTNSGTSKFDFTLYMVNSESGLTGELEYNTDLFDAATIDRIIEHFSTLLESIVPNPEQRLSELPILTKSEQQTLLVEWNDTASNYPKNTCIHQLFEAQVKRTPDAIAAVFKNQQITYQELNAKANQLAHYLASLGVQPNLLVGICVERSLEMLIALLGILKAGGTYVPLDPAHPQERLAFMLENAKVQVLLTQKQLVTALPKHNAKVICLDADWESIARESEFNPVSRSNADNLAYIIYTSGSTGKPKGVQIPHSGVVNFLTAMNGTLELTKGEVFLSVTTITFDIAGLELYLPLIRGDRTIIVSREVAADGCQLSALLAETNATVMQATPATWRMLLQAGWEGSDRLKILCGGEALSRELANQLLQKGSVVWNLYGPTETTIWSTIYRVEYSEGVVSIGKAIANTQLYVLDRHLQPVPIGVPGELYIGGAGLSRGYLNRPELTAEKFISNPFRNHSERRLYKTGDLVRYLPDGNLEYLGRIDYQVKIRGFRIELGEIEAALRQHPTVQEVVVMAREDKPGIKQLVAYIVSNEKAGDQTTFNNLRCFLREKLPEYMVPSTFVFLETLPLTPNGKVDRRALPTPDINRSDSESVDAAPRTPVEENLTKIWAEVLNLKQVGINDNFFDLGGDSILSVQVIAKAKKAGILVTPKQIFEHQTIAELATVAGTTATSRAEQEAIIGKIPHTPIQYWFFEQNLPEKHHWNLAIMVELRQPVSPDILKQALPSLLVQHDALRLRFYQEKCGWQQVNASPGDKDTFFAQIDLSTLSPTEQESVIQATITEIQSSLNLSQGPIARVAFFDLGVQQPSRLLIVAHHLAVDGFSWKILLEDLEKAIAQLSQGKTIQLPPKTTSFKQWSYRVQEYAKSAVLQQEKAYWLSQAQKPISPLPVDYPDGDNTVASAQTISIALSAEETNALLQQVPQVYQMQINDVLLSAIAQEFAQWTGHTSLLVDLEGNGRDDIFNDLDLSRTVGWFTTLLPVVLDLGKVTEPKDALISCKEQLRRITNEGLGYGVLRYLTEEATQLQSAPQAEVIFNYLGQLDRFIPEESIFKLTHWNLDPRRSPQGKRTHLLEGNAFVSNGQLWLTWTYSENLYKRATIESLTENCWQKLREIIAHCQSPEAGGYTPSDFPDVELSQAQLDKALAELEIF
jgi:amino acid adenylation domain-containing protein/non-ribosomal peptide synthase protein (TIGR01720 family)